MDPEKKSLKGFFSLLNIRHPKKFKSLAIGQVRHLLAFFVGLVFFVGTSVYHTNVPWEFRHGVIEEQAAPESQS